MPVAPIDSKPDSPGDRVADPTGPRAPGPRFALRFEAGRGRLTLAKRHRFAFGFVEALELDLGTLRFPLDLSRGPGRFRTRRTRVVHAELRVDLPLLLAEWGCEPYGVTSLAPQEQGVLVAVRDAFGTVATRVTAGAEGPNLALALSEARAATEGPAPPLARALVAARSLGLEPDGSRGCLIVRRALSGLLREALVPFGWRVPDDRACSFQLEVLSPDRIVLRTGDAAPLPAAFAVVARLAPLVGALTEGDRASAERQYRDLEERGVLDGPTRAAAAGLGFGDGPAEGPAGIAARLRDALSRGDGPAASREAFALCAVEPCDAVAVEGLSSAAELFVQEEPDRATGLLERAATRNPSDARVALRLAEILARLGRDADLARVARAAVNAREPGPTRGQVARAAAVICELSGHRELAGELFETAAGALPDDARSQEGLAEALALRGLSQRATQRFDRAAHLYAAGAEDHDAARTWLRGADLAEAADAWAEAEERLTRATTLRPDPAGHARLARVRRKLGSHAAAVRADNALLAATQRLGSVPAQGAVVAGLVAALEAALGADDTARARAFFDALHRLSPERAAPLAARFDALDVERWLSEPVGLLALSGERALSVIRLAPDPDALLHAACSSDTPEEAAVLEGWFRAAEEGEDPEMASRLASMLTGRVERLTDPEVLLRLEARAEDSEAAARIALSAASRLREAGRDADAARAQGRAGALRRDTAMLRAALTAAERAGAVDAALEIVELALQVVGQGPARRALETVRARLKS